MFGEVTGFGFLFLSQAAYFGHVLISLVACSSNPNPSPFFALEMIQQRVMAPLWLMLGVDIPTLTLQFITGASFVALFLAHTV